MVEEVLSYLDPRKGQTIADCTIGEGGHADLILERIGEEGMLIGMDKDGEILEKARKRFAGKSNVKLVHTDFRQARAALDGLGLDKLDGILFDFGVSSFHLDNPGRGFSFSHEGPLDMRLDRSREKTAEDIVNTLSESEIAEILRDYGEEPKAGRIARYIVKARKSERIKTTGRLKEIIVSATGGRHGVSHTATRTFQAVRIAVNDELASIHEAVRKTPEILRPGGRAVFISFHSLEDRIVKRDLRGLDGAGLAKILTKKPVLPSKEEVNSNSRARSAKLRALEVTRR